MNMENFSRLLLLTILGIFTVNTEGMSVCEVNSEKHENANTTKVNQNVAPVDEQYLQENFDGVELPENWRLIDLFDKYTGYEAISFWAVVALAKQLSNIDQNSFNDREKELIFDVREFIRVRSRQYSGSYYGIIEIAKKSVPTELTTEIMALFEHLVLGYTAGGQEKLAFFSKKSGKFSRQDFDELIDLAKEIGENLKKNQQTSDKKRIPDPVDKAVDEMPLNEEGIAEWFNKVSLDKFPFDEYNGYRGIIFWTLAEISKQFEGKSYAGMEEEALINRIKYYVKNRFTHEKPTYYNIKRDGPNDPGEQSGALISKARRFFSDLVFRYGNTDDTKIVNELSEIERRLCVDDFKKIVKLGKSIKKNITDRYERARQGDRINKAVGKIVSGVQTGTGTLVRFEGMPKTLQGRVVLTAGHCLERESKLSIDGVETFFGKSTNTSFDGIKVRAAYTTYPSGKDIGIAILDGKIDDREVLIEENKIPNESVSTLYSIGFGGFSILDSVEFGKRKATLEGKAKRYPFGLFESNLSYTSPLRIVGGDSGSPLIYRDNGGNEEIVGIVSLGGRYSSYGNCISNDVFTWIRSVCKRAAEENL